MLNFTELGTSLILNPTMVESFPQLNQSRFCCLMGDHRNDIVFNTLDFDDTMFSKFLFEINIVGFTFEDLYVHRRIMYVKLILNMKEFLTECSAT